MARKLAVPFLSALALFGLLACDGDGDSPEEETRLTEVGPPIMEVVETPQGRWRVSELAPPRAKVFGLEERRLEFSLEPDSLGFEIQPLIETREDLVGLYLGEPEFIDPESGMHTFFQTVPGVPEDPRFSAPRFQTVREAFSEACREQAAEYTKAFGAVEASADLLAALTGPSLTVSADYEANCLTGLPEVPAAIRGVLGVLSYNRGTFCSATIIGPKSVLTSRHCFFHAETGLPKATWEALDAGLVTFYSAEPHGGERVFSARQPLAPVGTAAFGPFDDHLLLRVIEGPFELMAEVATGPLSDANLPLPTWVVGSNALLGDITELQDPFFFVRGSAPLACAILATTSAGCLYHTCQTSGSTSGAGLLELNEGSVVLRGVHKGPIARAEGCEPAPPLTLEMNLAADFLMTDLGS